MSEEEKKAIETVKQYKKCFIFETVHEETGERINDYSNAIDIVLNLIRKQQKEIKEIKERNKKQFLNYEKKVNELEYKQLNYIRKDKIRTLLKQVNASLYHFKDSDKNNIMQRIKDRLEELLEK